MKNCPVTIRGEYFPSQSEAAKKFGLGPSAVAQSLLRHGHCDFVGIGPRRFGNTNAKSIPVEVGPFVFRSQLSASKALGVSLASIRRFSSGTAGGNYRQIVIGAAMEKLSAGELKEFLKEK